MLNGSSCQLELKHMMGKKKKKKTALTRDCGHVDFVSQHVVPEIADLQSTKQPTRSLAFFFFFFYAQKNCLVMQVISHSISIPLSLSSAHSAFLSSSTIYMLQIVRPNNMVFDQTQIMGVSWVCCSLFLHLAFFVNSLSHLSDCPAN